jgi:peroxiredoxin
MKRTKRFLSVLGLSVVALTLTAIAADNESKKAEIGEKAPNFTLTDQSGKEHNLADLKGKTVVLEWTNCDCPYVRGVYSRKVVHDTMKAMKEMGEDYVYLTVNSTANISKDEVLERSAKFFKKHDVKVPMLVDYDGEVGKMYGAKTTPHMYVIDAEGILRYNGAYTDDPRGRKDEPTNYVLNALNQIRKGETVAPDYVKPWGCSVKYKR